MQNLTKEKVDESLVLNVRVSCDYLSNLPQLIQITTAVE